MWVEIDMRNMKEAHPTLLKHTFWKGQHVSNGAWSKFKWQLIFVDLICHHLTCHG
jgi:hypothetical protein